MAYDAVRVALCVLAALAGGAALGACSASSSPGAGGSMDAGPRDTGAPGDGGVETKGWFGIRVERHSEIDDEGGATPVLYAYVMSVPYTSGDATERAREEAGPCTAIMSPIVTRDAGATPEAPIGLFGRMTIKGAGLPAAGITLLPENMFENALKLPIKGWNGGEELTFEATPGALPAFTERVVTQSDITLTAPVLVDPDVLALDRTADLIFRWSGGGAGAIDLSLYSSDTVAKRRAAIFCSFPAADGQGTVATALLRHLPMAGEEGIRGGYSLYPHSTSTFVSGEWDISLETINESSFATLRVTK